MAKDLPKNLPPRGLSCGQAAAWIGVSETLFRGMVERGEMPHPRRAQSRLIWDITELGEYFERLPRNGDAKTTPASKGQSWDDLEKTLAKDQPHAH